MSVEHPVVQEISHVLIANLLEYNPHQPEAGTISRGDCFYVGYDGVTRIEACTKSGMHADIPYIRIWRGDMAVAEFCQHSIVGVYFQGAGMTVYRTCYGCISRGKPCERRDTIAKAIKGLSVQSLKFKCADRKPLFAIGAPVWVKTVYDMSGDSDENGIPVDYYPGHMIRDLGTKVLIYVRPGSRGRGDVNDEDPLEFVSRNNGFCKVSLSKVTPRDGEIEAVCEHCELPASMGHQENYPCNPAYMASLGLSQTAEEFQ